LLERAAGFDCPFKAKLGSAVAISIFSASRRSASATSVILRADVEDS
jgi:hypothetical protein